MTLCLCSVCVCSGCYPVFKAGEASLGNQLLVVQVEKSVTESQEPQSAANDLSTVLEILVCGVRGPLCLALILSIHVHCSHLVAQLVEHSVLCM